MKRKMIRVEVCPAAGDMPWKVTVAGIVKVYSLTQQGGLNWAREYVGSHINAGIAFTVKVKGLDGKIKREIKREHTYPRSSDPRRSKG